MYFESCSISLCICNIHKGYINYISYIIHFTLELLFFLETEKNAGTTLPCQ